MTASLIGVRLDNYEVQALIGSGGMAQVYRGFDLNLQRPVAIKVLSESVAAQPGFTERFRQEARLIANLRHPNIVQVYNFGEYQQHIFMVQELLPGPTLEQWLADRAARGVLPTRDEVQAVITQMAGALDAAHAAGIIHRDVKPSNMLWNASGALVLTDFGIAKQTLAGLNQTQAGLVIGTPNYLSPEQAQGLATLTPASDVYALGVVLYELLAGRVPFDGGTPMQVVLDHVQSPPPPLRARRPDLPAQVEAVVMRALHKDPQARYARAGELARALADAWSGRAAATQVVPPADIHNQATSVWTGAQPVAPRPVAPRPATPPPTPARPPTASYPPAPPPDYQTSPALPPTRTGGCSPLVVLLVVGLLGIVLVAGATFAFPRGDNNVVVPTAPLEVPTLPPAEQPTAPAEPPTPEQPTPEPPTAPPVEPTAEPPTFVPPTKPPLVAETVAPPPTPQPPVDPPQPPQPGQPQPEPLAQLNQLLSDINTEEQLGSTEELTEQLAELQEQLNEGDDEKATETLEAIRARVVDAFADSRISGDQTRQALERIDAVALAYELVLKPLPPTLRGAPGPAGGKRDKPGKPNHDKD